MKPPKTIRRVTEGAEIPSATLWRMTAGAVMISFSGVWVKTAQVSAVTSAFYRVFFGGLILCAAARLHREPRQQKGAQPVLRAVCAAVFALDLALYHYGINTVGPGLGTILPNFQVFILAAFGMAFLGERLRWMHLVAVPAAVGGLFLIIGIDWDRLEAAYRIGIVCGLAAAVFYAVFLLLLRRLQAAEKSDAAFSLLGEVCLITSAFLAAGMLLTGDTFAIPDLQSAVSLAALGFFSQVLGWVMITRSLPRIRASLAGLILLLQPALAFVWDVLLFGRPTTALNWVGVALTLAAIYMGTLGQSTAGRSH